MVMAYLPKTNISSLYNSTKNTLHMNDIFDIMGPGEMVQWLTAHLSLWQEPEYGAQLPSQVAQNFL